MQSKLNLYLKSNNFKLAILRSDVQVEAPVMLMYSYEYRGTMYRSNSY